MGPQPGGAADVHLTSEGRGSEGKVAWALKGAHAIGLEGHDSFNVFSLFPKSGSSTGCRTLL